jgi:glucose/arabinose dehydrogenase
LQNAGDGSGRLFVVEQPGRILVFQNSDTTSDAEVFLDIRSQVVDAGAEQGLLGLAFHPSYAGNGHYFVYFSVTDSTKVARFTINPQNPNSTDAGTQRDVIAIHQFRANHNGGQIAFGPGDMLHIGVGDGGSANDPRNHGQDRTTLQGNILRINVSSLPYTIPVDNPFRANQMGYREEIWAYGLRNPWRFSFDPVTDRVWCGDVGQNAWEEIDVIKKGKNYGWRIMEASHCRPPTTGCDTDGLELPVWEYSHMGAGRSVTGGYVYRGSRLGGLVGAYIYADYVTGEVWALRYSGAGAPSNALLVDTNLNIASFGVDEAGELLICALDGRIYELVARAN